MSRHNLSQASQLYAGKATFPTYQQDKLGVELHALYRWKPTGTRAFTAGAAPAAGATSFNLSANWAGPSGYLPITFSDGEQFTGLFANGSEAVSLYPATPPLTGGSYGVTAGLVNAVTTAITVGNLPPVVGSSTGYAASQSISAGANANLNGSLVSNSVGTPDVARNVVGAWTTSSTVTVTGTDAYGQAQTESQTGTSFTGKKAFATVTAIKSSAAVTAATFGTGNVLGMPFRVGSGDFFSPMFNDAADAGTFVAADQSSAASATTGDVRGTYALAGTLNGAKYLSALIKVQDTGTQVGAFGSTPA